MWCWRPFSSEKIDHIVCIVEAPFKVRWFQTEMQKGSMSYCQRLGHSHFRIVHWQLPENKSRPFYFVFCEHCTNHCAKLCLSGISTSSELSKALYVCLGTRVGTMHLSLRISDVKRFTMIRPTGCAWAVLKLEGKHPLQVEIKSWFCWYVMYRTSSNDYDPQHTK